jgi:hypothetical protein
MRHQAKSLMSGVLALVVIVGLASALAVSAPSVAGASLLSNPASPLSSAIVFPAGPVYPYAEVNGIACAGTCYAVGTESSTGNFSDVSTDAPVWWGLDGLDITGPFLLSPDGAAGIQMAGITCSAGCMAYGNAISSVASGIVYSGPNFGTVSAGISGHINSMNCDKTGLCLIAGTNGSDAVVWQYGSTITEVSSGATGSFRAVGCSAGSCVAVGTTVSSGQDIGAIGTPLFPGQTSSTVIGVSISDVTGTTSLAGIDCSASCLAVGNYVDSVGDSHGLTATIPYLPFTNQISAGQWVDSPGQTEYSGGGLTSGLVAADATSATCPNTDCYIGGQLSVSNVPGDSYISLTSGGIPAELIDLGPNAVVNQVACTSASACYAVGSATIDGTGPTPTVWAISSVPDGGSGYWLASSDGSVTSFGAAVTHAVSSALPHQQASHQATAHLTLNSPVVGIAATADKRGYWLVGGDGGIFAYGDAPFLGSMGGQPLNKPIVGIAASSDGTGYWEVAADGGVFSFGDAHFYGSMGGKPLNQPIVGIAASPDGKGYWEVAADGGVFSFGDAEFEGSTGAIALNQPIVGMSATSNGQGYWMVAKDGGIFAFGDAPFFGSKGGTVLNAPVVAMLAAPDSGGYLLVAKDGGIFAFGDAGYFGSLGGRQLSAPVVAIGGT